MKTIDLGNDCELDCTIYGYFISFALRKVDKSTPFATLVWEWPSEKAMREEMAEMVKQDIGANWFWPGEFVECIDAGVLSFCIRTKENHRISIHEGPKESKFSQLQTYLREQFGKVERPLIVEGDSLFIDDEFYIVTGFGSSHVFTRNNKGKAFDFLKEFLSVDKHYRNGELLWEREG